VKVYISGVLTDGDEIGDLKTFYEEIGQVCKELGLEPYIPHQHTDPAAHPQFTPRDIYQKDRRQIAASRLVVAYVGRPSLGVGAEIEIAHQCGVPVILLYEGGKTISRMARGNPAVAEEVIFTDFEDALARLLASIQRVLTGDTKRAYRAKRTTDNG